MGSAIPGASMQPPGFTLPVSPAVGSLEGESGFSHWWFQGEKHEIWVDATVRRVQPSGFSPQPIRQWPLGTTMGLVAAGRTRGAVFNFQPEKGCGAVTLQGNRGTLYFQLWPREQTPCTKGCTICPILSKEELPHVRVRNLNSCLEASAAPQGEWVPRLDQATQQARPQVFTKPLS